MKHKSLRVLDVLLILMAICRLGVFLITRCCPDPDAEAENVILYPSPDANTSVIDNHDPNLYTLVISYDPPPSAPPPDGSGGGGKAV